jgi:hypothetical protein
MSQSISIADFDKAKAETSTAPRLNIPVRITRFDLSASLVVGERLDAELADIQIGLRPDPKASTRSFQRADLTRLDRKLRSGGVLRFDGANQEPDGKWSAGWATVMTHGPFDDQLALIGQVRVNPYIPPPRPNDPHRLGLDLLIPGTAYKLSSEQKADDSFLQDALHRAIGVPDSSRPWGTPSAWIYLRVGADIRAQRVVLQYGSDNVLKPVADNLDLYLPRAKRQTLKAAIDASRTEDIAVGIAKGFVFYMGRDLIKQAVEKGSLLPDRWYRSKPDTQTQIPGDPQESLFTMSSIAIRRRSSGSWYFTEVLPLSTRPELKTPAELLDQALRPQAMAAGESA